MGHWAIIVVIVAALASALAILKIVFAVRRAAIPFQTESHAFVDTVDTPLGAEADVLASEKGALSGFSLINHGTDAFAARISLTELAVRSLDLQYYLWRNDLCGVLLLNALHKAADRGVRIRILLDGNGAPSLYAELMALSASPNVQVRIFNPFLNKRWHYLEYLISFDRLNRRMHNKCFIADNAFAIIGGRNIGDEYFAVDEKSHFADLDALAVGPIVGQLSTDFDRFWSSSLAYPLESLCERPPTSSVCALTKRLAEVMTLPLAQYYVQTIRSVPSLQIGLSKRLDWAPARLVSDDPAKALGRAKPSQLLGNRLNRILETPTREISLISAYFVPTMAGVDVFTMMRERGVEIQVITNSFAATDVWVVHAGYASYREELLRKGIRLFELKGRRRSSSEKRNLLSSGASGQRGKTGKILRSTATTLHAKTFTIDRRRLFIGSFNFDPRSMHLNTELGFVIESPTLANRVELALAKELLNSSYELKLSDKGKLVWLEHQAGTVIKHRAEPETSAWQRIGLRVLSNMPIEWLL